MRKIKMEANFDYITEINKAQSGDKNSLDCLSRQVQERLREDVFRLTLDDNLTEDIVQETMLEMLKILNELKEADQFWSWLYKMALNKLRLHHRKEQVQKTAEVSAVNKGGKGDSRDVISETVARELKEIVLRAMERLKPDHRAVITMRCYRQMQYSMIAKSMGRSEFAAKMLFCRAKKSLKRQLAREGFGKGSLLMALVIFGQMTSRSRAASISVPAATFKVGTAVGLAGVLTSKSAIVTLAAAGIVGAGSLVVTSSQMQKGAEGVGALPRAHIAGTMDTYVKQYLYFYPHGVAGPVMIKAETQNEGRSGACVFLQNAEANYVYHPKDNAVYLVNHRQYNKDGSVWRLPSDEPHTYKDSADLMMIDERVGDGTRVYQAEYPHALKDEYFRYSWPAETRVIDNRDAMHKRGWTYFTVEGRMDGERVSGAGRVPFVYAAGAEHGPWLKLNMADRLEIIDDGQQAITRDAGKVTASYETGSFFKGLSRPWMGLHTIDTVRRDAAEREVAFETKYEPKEQKAELILTTKQGKLVYTIDMQEDVVDEIAFSMNDGSKGYLRFSYLQNIGEAGYEFSEPRISRNYGSKRRANPGILWLMQILTGK